MKILLLLNQVLDQQSDSGFTEVFTTCHLSSDICRESLARFLSLSTDILATVGPVDVEESNTTKHLATSRNSG